MVNIPSCFIKVLKTIFVFPATNIFDYVKIASLFLAARKIRQEIDYAKTIFDDKNLADSDLCHGILKALACRNGAAYEEAYHAYSIVWSKKNIYAIKCVSRSKVNKEKVLGKYLLNERRIMLAIDHPFIVKLIKMLKNIKI